MAWLRSRINLGMNKPHPLGIAWGMVGIEDDALAAFKPDLPLRQRTYAELRSLQIGKNSDGTVLAFKFAQGGNVASEILMA